MNNSILMRKFRQYLVPSIFTSLALALNEFVDCMLVSNMLGQDALAIANLGCPVILIIAACYVLLGTGGSILYATHLGKWENEKAGKIFTLSIIASVVLGLMLVVFGLAFKAPLTSLLCVDEGLRSEFAGYYGALLAGAPILVFMLTFVCFLPPSGAPVEATIANIVANGSNLIFDIVYIKVFHLGVTGAAYATLSGYLIGSAVMFILIKNRGVVITRTKIGTQDLKRIKNIITLGAPTAVLQICFAIKYAFSNNMAAIYGGRTGVIAFSLCLQTFSIASVFLLGVCDTAQPLLAMLSGQKDYEGEGMVLKRSFMLQVIFACLVIGFFELRPTAMTRMYGVNDEEVLRIALTGIRIFTITYLPRGICIQFMRYFQVEGRKLYAFAISLMDGFLVIPTGLILCRSLAEKGIFAAYPVSALIALCLILLNNVYIYRRGRDEYKGISLIRSDKGTLGTMNFTITDDDEDISRASEEMIDFGTEHGLTMKEANKVGLLCEEMAVYTRTHRKDTGDIDIMLRIGGEDMIIDFRSIGAPFDPTMATDEDSEENILMLSAMASDIAYDYIMGMNSTRIKVLRRA
ncbi:MAG: hypothetical protein K5857_01855 [Lachnospiraceae bacterium]|nr:hypothetical protein [Lachnospiraceae bacterium]